MLKTLMKYIKFYLEPDAKSLRSEAFESAKRYYRNSGPMQPPMEVFQAYQHGYIHAYRKSYARNKLKS